jgi:hypothetical protein
MFRMFNKNSLFNQAVGNWNVSSVTTIMEMFALASNFNQAIGTWNVSGVTDMRGVFYEATKFNQAIGNWDVSKVTDTYAMFWSAFEFNQDLCAWYNKLKNTTAIVDTLPYSGCTYQADPNFSTKTSFCQACSCSGGEL